MILHHLLRHTLFSEKDNLSNNYLSLLTIEPNDVYKNKVYYIEDKRVIGLDLIEDVITEKELYKCAFIQNLDEEKRFDDYDLIILEPQRKNISKFLLDKFLDAEESLDDKKRTEKFYRASLTCQEHIKNKYGLKKYNYFINQKNAALNQSEINYNTFIDSLNFPKNIKDEIREIYNKQLPDYSFSVDEQTRQELTKIRKFKGDYNFELKIENQYYNDVIKVQEEKDTNGEDYYEITIKTKKWHEIK